MTKIGSTEILLVCAAAVVVLIVIGYLSAHYHANKSLSTPGQTCANCGKLNPTENDFCGQCGQPLKGSK